MPSCDIRQCTSKDPALEYREGGRKAVWYCLRHAKMMLHPKDRTPHRGK